MAIDYGRSYVTFVTPGRGNNARLQVESVCTIKDAAAGTRTDYFFFASCKSEHTFAERGLFHEENYDFCGIFSDTEYAIFRTHATHTDGWREEGLWADRFEEVRFGLVKATTEPLDAADKIVQASLSGIPLIGEVTLTGGTLSATLQFPIKTMNANDIETIYQVDTGPLPLPDLDAAVERHVQRFSPAYVAYNAPDFADFVVQQPVVAAGSVAVTHYANPISLPARTRVLAVR